MDCSNHLSLLIGLAESEYHRTGKLSSLRANVDPKKLTYQIHVAGDHVEGTSCLELVDKLTHLFVQEREAIEKIYVQIRLSWNSFFAPLRKRIGRVVTQSRLHYRVEQNWKRMNSEKWPADLEKDMPKMETAQHLLTLEAVQDEDLHKALQAQTRLFDSFIERQLKTLTDEEARTLYPEVIDHLLALMNPTDDSALGMPTVKHKSALHYAVMVGSLAQIEKIYERCYGDNFKRLAEIGDDPDCLKPLHWAVKLGYFEVASRLIALGADINAIDRFTCSTLLQSVIRNDSAAVNFCLTLKECETAAANPYDETALHLAAKCQDNGEVIRALLSHPKMKNNLKVKDLFGRTPLETAILYANDEAIKLYSGDDRIDPGSLPGYGQKPLIIRQRVILNQKLKFLELMNRDKETSDALKLGHCNGYAFLRQYYKSRGKKHEFVQVQRLFSSWDGKKDSLTHKVDNKLSGNYPDLACLFDQWINDTIWFQHADVVVGEQYERCKMYEVVAKDLGWELEFLMLPQTSSLHDASLAERLKIFSLIPGVVIEFGGAGHCTNVSVEEDGSFDYFCANIPEEIQPFRSINRLVKFIRDTKYTYVNEGGELRIYVYRFRDQGGMAKGYAPDIEPQKIVELFDHFREPSPDGNSPFHIALYARQLPFLKWCLDNPELDINAQDIYGRTPLVLAQQLPHSQEMVRLLLEHGAN